MVSLDERNRLSREQSRLRILGAAIELFAACGVSSTSISQLTQRAGVAQGLVNYHFGSKAQLISAVIDQWFETMIVPPREDGSADERLTSFIDGVFLSADSNRLLCRAVLALRQQPDTRRLYARSEERFSGRLAEMEDGLRSLFRERGASDPVLEQVMLRCVLDGILSDDAVYRDSFPLRRARQWVCHLYNLDHVLSPLEVEARVLSGQDLRPRTAVGVPPG